MGPNVERGVAGRSLDCRPRRILYVSHVGQVGGAEIVLRNLLAGAGEAIQAHAILAESGPLVDLLREVNVEVEVLPLKERARSLRRGQMGQGVGQARAASDIAIYVGRLARRIRQLRPDIVHTNSLKAGVYGSLAARLANRPVVWNVNDRIAADYLGRAALPTRILINILPTAVVVPSRVNLATLGGFRRRAVIVEVIPGAVPVPTKPVRRGREFLRIGIVGRLAPWKGQHLFLDAFSRAFPEGNVRGTVIGGALFGEEEYALALRERARKLAIDDRIDFRGFQSNVYGELAHLDAVVHASTIPEPFGMVILEAMAAGVPVISTRGGGNEDFVRDGEDGILYPAGDIASLADAMSRLAGDPEFRMRLATSGRQRAREYTPEAIGAQLLRLYDRVLNLKRP